MARKPKQERRREVLNAAKRLLSREGTQSTSVRRVAEEAGMSAGSLRHIFPSHEEMFTALLLDGREATSASLATLRQHPAHRDLPLDMAVDLLMEVLPTDPDARVSLLAQLAVHTTHPDAATVRDAMRGNSAELDELCHAVVTATCPPEDIALAALELRLMIDGLSLRLLESDTFGEADARAALQRRLRELCFL